MSMCELGQQPHDAACRAGICEVQLSGLLGGWARRQVPHWEFLEEIFCCAVEKSIHTDKCPDYLHNSSSSFPLCLLSWGSKVFHLAESKRATLPFVSHRNSTELCTQYHHSFSFIFFIPLQCVQLWTQTDHLCNFYPCIAECEAWGHVTHDCSQLIIRFFCQVSVLVKESFIP